MMGMEKEKERERRSLYNHSSFLRLTYQASRARPSRNRKCIASCFMYQLAYQLWYRTRPYGHFWLFRFVGIMWPLLRELKTGFLAIHSRSVGWLNFRRVWWYEVFGADHSVLLRTDRSLASCCWRLNRLALIRFGTIRSVYLCVWGLVLSRGMAEIFLR